MERGVVDAGSVEAKDVAVFLVFVGGGRGDEVGEGAAGVIG